MNTANRLRKRGLRQGSAQSLRGASRGCGLQGARGARISSATPKASARASTVLTTAMPNSVGSTLAISTPIRPKPSRQATMRERCTGSPPSRVPQAWWITVSTLKAV